MKCNNCGTEMESINKWMDAPYSGLLTPSGSPIEAKHIHMLLSKTVSGVIEQRKYDLWECPKCGECKIIRIKDGE